MKPMILQKWIFSFVNNLRKHRPADTSFTFAKIRRNGGYCHKKGVIFRGCNKINTLNFNEIRINYAVPDGTYGF
jgi:hypothetical protein